LSVIDVSFGRVFAGPLIVNASILTYSTPSLLKSKTFPDIENAIFAPTISIDSY
jgi:hypothetical protein